ncbi:TIR domain-containing adapter molecule 1 [Heptranchias perlo]|uniref:TIR domain-containing adapter molecule 1 n=1 Tax=Heptranchias perlo TaxID=212740 RepID=UPI00355971C3
MAEDCDRTPSFDDLFDILSGIPEERLRSLWYKFNPENSRASKAHQLAHRLLYSIVSFFLKKKDEVERIARSVSSDAPANRSALYVFNKIQGSDGVALGKRGAAETPNEEFAEEDGSVLTDLARILMVLVEENLCGPSVRDRACRAAIKVFKSNSQDRSMELRELIEEFSLQCGSLDFEDEENAEVSALKSIEEPSPSMRSTIACRTNPMTIPIQKPTESLNTSEITMPSHFEISASPTASFISSSCQDNLNSSIANPEECGVNTANSTNVSLNNYNNAVLNLPSACCVEERKVTDSTRAQHGEQEGALSVCPTKSSSRAKVNETRPTECTGNTKGGLVVTSKSKLSGDQGTRNGEHTNSISHNPSLGMRGNQTNCSATTSLGKFSPSGVPSEIPFALSATLSLEESFENKFYPFVVLHASEDVEIAESVRVRLESLGVVGGATFCGDFSIPGQSPIKCIEDAINNSAFTILLLTNNFKTRWADYETNMVLMHSINNEHKYNTVIPLLPKEDWLRENEIPFALNVIHGLDENSKYFERYVKKTFRKCVLEKHKKVWLSEQCQKQTQEKIKQVERDVQRAQEAVSARNEYMQLCNQLALMQQRYQFFQLSPTTPPHPGSAAVNGQAQPMLNPPLYPGFGFSGVYPPGFNYPLPPGFDYPLPPMLPNQQNCNPHPAFCQFMQPPFQPLNPGNSQVGQNVTVSSSAQQQGQGPNIIQIQHATNVQIGDSNQMTITESTESSESTDGEEEEDGDHN